MNSPYQVTAKSEAPKRSRSTSEQGQEIKRRVYELFEECGKECGQSLDNWFQAELELSARPGNTLGA